MLIRHGRPVSTAEPADEILPAGIKLGVIPRLIALEPCLLLVRPVLGPSAAAANSSVRQALSKRTDNITADGASTPTVTAPWLGIRIALASPKAFANDRPSSGVGGCPEFRGTSVAAR
jgi:hypothetical protein